LRFIDTVDDKLVANMPEKMVDNLKNNFKTNIIFPLLMDEIKNIHLSFEKKFLLFDKKNTMGIP
jgi:hypothetical protein